MLILIPGFLWVVVFTAAINTGNDILMAISLSSNGFLAVLFGLAWEQAQQLDKDWK